jgi:hypothetical protein
MHEHARNSQRQTLRLVIVLTVLSHSRLNKISSPRLIGRTAFEAPVDVEEASK